MASSVQTLFLLRRNGCKFNCRLCVKKFAAVLVKHWVSARRKAYFSSYEFCAQLKNVLSFVRYCNSHLQVLGIVPKKNRKKKPIESIESNSNSVLNSSETNFKLDGVMAHTTSMVFVPPMAIPFQRKKTKLHTEKKETFIPAVCEVKDRYKLSQRGRHNLFSVYGKSISVLNLS